MTARSIGHHVPQHVPAFSLHACLCCATVLECGMLVCRLLARGAFVGIRYAGGVLSALRCPLQCVLSALCGCLHNDDLPILRIAATSHQRQVRQAIKCCRCVLHVGVEKSCNYFCIELCHSVTSVSVIVRHSQVAEYI